MRMGKFGWMSTLFVVIYSIIFFLIIPVLFYELHYLGIGLPFGMVHPWFYYLFFLIILCIILSIPCYFHRKQKKNKEYKKPGSLVTVLWVVFVLYLIFVVISTPWTILTGPTCMLGVTIFVVELLILVVFAGALFYFRIYNKKK